MTPSSNERENNICFQFTEEAKTIFKTILYKNNVVESVVESLVVEKKCG